MRQLSRFGFIQRNKMIILVAGLSFMGIVYFSILLAFSAFLLFPGLKTVLDEVLKTQVEHAPEFFTWDFFVFIFTNNAGHFCNFLKMLVWIPLFGLYLLGLELGLNGVVIGTTLVYAWIEKGVLFTAIAIIPHGIIEIPAFIFQCVCFARWNVTIIEFLHAKITGEKWERTRIVNGLTDVTIFASIALTLFFFAALIETFVTPALLDFVFGRSWRS